MTGIAVSNTTIDKHFRYLLNLDNASKKRLIRKLSESLSYSRNEDFDMKSIFGSWDDDRDSDEIIKEIRDSRINYNDIENF
jgi:hypothetical protein